MFQEHICSVVLSRSAVPLGVQNGPEEPIAHVKVVVYHSDNVAFLAFSRHDARQLLLLCNNFWRIQSIDIKFVSFRFLDCSLTYCYNHPGY